MPRRVNVTAARVLTLLLLAAPSWSWGSVGHRIIAIIAEQRVSPVVREKIRAILVDGKYSLADISNCADRLRSADQRPEDEDCRMLAGVVPPVNATWHYIQIPVPTKAKKLQPFCPQDNCVTARIASFAETLRDSKDPAEQRQALLFLVHLVGDIHQPLHVVNRACDMGGNSERVNFYIAGKKLAHENLHTVWDTDELDLLMADYKVTDEHGIADAMAASISSIDAADWASATPEIMAWESYRIAIGAVYPAVPYQNFCGTRGSPAMDTNLSLSYEEDGSKVVQRQLMKAGVRLAAILDLALEEN